MYDYITLIEYVDVYRSPVEVRSDDGPPGGRIRIQRFGCCHT